MEQRLHHGSKLAAVFGAWAKEGNVMDWKLGGLMLLILAGCSQAEPQREPAPHLADDPRTTNDESNDQPLRTAGAMTLCVTNHGSGNSYPLDADMDGGEVISIYFPKGGSVDFTGCELADDLSGECDDDEGRGWTFDGEC